MTWKPAGSFLVPLLVAAFLFGEGRVHADGAPGRATGSVVLAFTRQVERCTGDGAISPGHVIGQDSAIAVAYGGEVRIFFGDTSVDCNGRQVWLPNSMATTTDLDASDGLDLDYYLPGLATPVLEPIGQEGTVWLMAVFVHGTDIWAYYLSVLPGWPEVPPLGAGLAVMREGKPPFVRTAFYVFADDPIYRTGIAHAFVEDGYVHLFGRINQGYASVATLKRVPLDALERREAYEFWTTSGWSDDPEPLGVLFTEAGSPSVHWSDHHQQYLAVYSVLFSPYGFLSAVAFRTAPALTGPWSDPTPINGAPGTGWGSNYAASWNPVFSRDNGRVVYFTSTDWSAYNVFLYETSFEFGRADMRTVGPDDVAYERGCRTASACPSPRVGRHRLPLRRQEQTIAAVRLVGTSFFPVSPVTALRLRLPLHRALPEALTLTLRISVEAPNRPAFDRRLRGDLALRPMIASTVVTVTLPAGATALELHEELAPLIDAATAHPDWVPGRINSLAVFLTRTDSARRTLRLAATDPMGAGQASLCHGRCDPGWRTLEASGTRCGG